MNDEVLKMGMTLNDFANAFADPIKSPLDGYAVRMNRDVREDAKNLFSIEWWTEMPLKAISLLGKINEGLGAPECNVKLLGEKTIVYSYSCLGGASTSL